MANPSHFQIQIPLIISCENIIITKLNLHLLTMYRTVIHCICQMQQHVGYVGLQGISEVQRPGSAIDRERQ